MEDPFTRKHYDAEHGVKFDIITSKKRYHPPYSSKNPKVLKKHIDIDVLTWEELSKLKVEMRSRNFSELIKYLVKRERERIKELKKKIQTNRSSE